MRTIQEIFEKPKHKAQLLDAIRFESRLRMHHAVQCDLSEMGITMHLDMVEGLLPVDAFERYKQLFIVPLPTSELLETVFKEQKRVFDGQNGRTDVNFETDIYDEDFAPFIKKVRKWVRTKGWEMYKTNYNGIVVIDMEEVSETNRPTPKIVQVNVDMIHDIDVDKKGHIEYVMYCTGGNHYVYIDSEKYAKFEIENGQMSEYVEMLHDFDMCPVTWFWNDTIENLTKKHPNASSVNALDMLLFSMVSKEYNELFCKYPQMWTYEQSELLENLGGGDEPIVYNNYSAGNGQDGSDNINMGAGKIHMIPMNSEISGAPVGFVSAPIENLRYIQEDLHDRADRIFQKLTGVSMSATAEAKNEKQIQSEFESRKNVLMTIKHNFEKLEAFILHAFAMVRYGQHPKVIVDYGDEFYLQDSATLFEMFEQARLAGAPESDLHMMYKQMLHHKYRNNPKLANRAEILLHVEPLPFVSIENVLNLPDSEMKGIKLHFQEFVDRYELEQETINVALDIMGKQALVQDMRMKFKEYYTELNINPNEEEIQSNPTTI